MSKFLVVLVALTASSTWAQTGVGAKHGTRDPHVCTATKEPAKGAPSAAQAKEYVTCDAEHVFGDSLYLVDNVQVQVAKPRPFNILTDSADNIDPTQPVYNLKGSLTKYQCARLGMSAKAGSNCDVHPHPNATGKCYKDTFNEWHCQMQDLDSGSDYRLTVRNQPPPK